MGKGLVLDFAGAVSTTPLEKLERARLYGTRRRVAVDGQGRTCTRAALTDDGAVLLRSGMTAQGWFDVDGRQVESGDIGAVDDQGRPLELVASTLDARQSLAEAPAHELLDLAPTAVYVLDANGLAPALVAALGAGKIFRFPFNYRPDYRCETAFIVKNDAGAFVVVGIPTEAPWAEANAPPPADDDDSDDELDFEMF